MTYTLLLAAALMALVTTMAPAPARTLGLAFEPLINPALSVMLLVTFLQVPLAELGRALTQVRFLAALLLVNFVLIPLLVAALLGLLPAEPLWRLGVVMVLVCPCIDYVVTFAHAGRADARALLAATPTLLLAQMVLLPLYLDLLLDAAPALTLDAGPFLHAFVWMIAIPLALAALIQTWAAKHRLGARLMTWLGVLPVPATALVLFLVVASVVPQLEQATDAVWAVLPIFAAFAALATTLGWLTARAFRLPPRPARAVAFSAGSRNGLVILPLALAVPGAVPVLPVILLTQTLVELVAELVYIRLLPLFPRLGRRPH